MEEEEEIIVRELQLHQAPVHPESHGTSNWRLRRKEQNLRTLSMSINAVQTC